MKKDNKQQLFEMLSKIDPSFKPKIGEEEYPTSIPAPEYTQSDTGSVGGEQIRIAPEHMRGHFKQYEEGELDRVPWSYLHGDLESKAQYDKFSIIGKAPTEEGIYPAVVEFPDENIDAMFYFWFSPEAGGTDKRRGLVVKKGDTHAMEDAQEKFDSKSDRL
jgi:hypothetical protein